jgi:cation:H+ antiporter
MDKVRRGHCGARQVVEHEDLMGQLEVLAGARPEGTGRQPPVDLLRVLGLCWSRRRRRSSFDGPPLSPPHAAGILPTAATAVAATANLWSTLMVLALVALVVGLVLLVWSADRFIEGSAAVARHLGMPPLLIGMVVVGFGTSAPELTVSALAAVGGNAGIALGNAYGSNIVNIALILGLTALISPIGVHSRVVRRELPILMVVTAIAAWQLRDGMLSGIDAWLLLAVFAGLMIWTIHEGLTERGDVLAAEMVQELDAHRMPPGRAAFWVAVGLVALVASSRLLVWGAVTVAQSLGISDLIIGLTVVAVGTSLPELASSLMAARKGEHDIALGNILGSNLFNTLAVVGVAGAIHPLEVAPDVLSRDIPVMAFLTIALFAMSYGFRAPGRIDRRKGGLLMAGYLAYTLVLVRSVVAG